MTATALRLNRKLDAINGSLLIASLVCGIAYLVMRGAPAFPGSVVVKGLSVGYQVIRDEVTEGIRKLIELRLFEVSLVTFPMNPAATVNAVKSAQHQRDEIARATRELREFYQALTTKNS